MRFRALSWPSRILRWSFALLLFAPSVVHGQWQTNIGAETPDMGTQAFAFLPNEIWIHAGDNITWTSNTDEPHTLTLLTPGQVRPFFLVGCPGTSPSGSPFDGSTCVNSGFMFKGNTYSVSFPSPGNFKFVCLLHEDMTGAVHVLTLVDTLPYNQAVYNTQATNQARALITNVDASFLHANSPAPNGVIAGIGEVDATPAGKSTATILRFLQGTITVHAGDTVEWANNDPITPHTVTFGPIPANVVPPSGNVTTDDDGALHATLKSTSDAATSGIIIAAPQERLGLAQAPLGTTRFRVTFPHPGTYNYVCALHFPLGMVGRVIVQP